MKIDSPQHKTSLSILNSEFFFSITQHSTALEEIIWKLDAIILKYLIPIIYLLYIICRLETGHTKSPHFLTFCLDAEFLVK